MHRPTFDELRLKNNRLQLSGEDGSIISNTALIFKNDEATLGRELAALPVGM